MLMQKQHHRTKLAFFSLLTCACLLLGCDRGDATKDAERELSAKEGDARATGSACRQAGRALEDCYNLNPTAERASVFAGWRDMNDYMRENKMEEVKPAGLSKAATASAPENAETKKDENKK